MAYFADLQSSCRVTRGRENRDVLALEFQGANLSVAHKSCDSRRAPRFPKVPTRAQLSSGVVFLKPASSVRRQAPRLQQRLHATLVSCSSGEEKGPVVVIDNYDSFTYNICQYLGALECDYVVYKNDEITVEEIRSLNPSGILLGPGPGTPEDSGISLQTVRELGPDFPLFGVCMGHQCIGQVFGGSIVRAQTGVMHGKSSPVEHTDVGVLQGLPSPFTAARYHSLVIDHENFPDTELEILGRSDDGMVMAVKHLRYPHIQGVQFHPESCITPEGMQIMRNFLGMVETGVIKE